MQLINFLNKKSGVSLNLLVDEDKKTWIDSKSIENYSHLKSDIYLISDLFSSFQIDLPETSLANQEKSLPFLIQDKLLKSIDEYVWSLNSVSKIVTLVDLNIFEEIINEIDLFKVEKLIPFETALNESLIILIDNLAIINIKNSWSWSGDIHQLFNFLPDIKERFFIEKIDCFQAGKPSNKLKSFDFINLQSFGSNEEILENLFPFNSSNNFLKGRFESRINWLEIFTKFKFYIYAGLALFSIFLFSTVIQLAVLSISNNQLENNLNEVFKSKFPNERIKSNIISQVNSLLSSSSSSKKNLELVAALSNEISIIDNISLVSINYDAFKFFIEIEAVDYQDIQNLVDNMSDQGINISIGSSRRVNNLIVGELNVSNI